MTLFISFSAGNAQAGPHWETGSSGVCVGGNPTRPAPEGYPDLTGPQPGGISPREVSRWPAPTGWGRCWSPGFMAP